MAMASSVGKTYDEIWKGFCDEHLKYSSITDLKRIHDKWKLIAAQTK